MRPRRDGDSGLHAVPIFAALDRHGVRYVAVGSYSAIAQGIDLDLTDLDIVPAIDADNGERLAAALKDLHAYDKSANTIEDSYDFMNDPEMLTDTKFSTFVTEFGELDVILRPAGFPQGYNDLIKNALSAVLRDDNNPTIVVEAVLADVHDIYESKRLAGRRKDIDALPRFIGIHPSNIRESVREQYRADQLRRTQPPGLSGSD